MAQQIFYSLGLANDRETIQQKYDCYENTPKSRTYR
jgi:hypothetical protein